VRIRLSSGESEVKFKFLRTPSRLTSEIISLIGLFIAAFLFLKFFFKKKPSSF